jgi:hypothetical protein
MVFPGIGNPDLNSPPVLEIKHESNGLCSVPDHHQGIRCKAQRSDD